MVDAAGLFSVLVTGVGIGALYSLVAIGFALIYKITGVLNFAQGQFALLGAFLVVVLSTSVPFWLFDVQVPVFAALLLTVVIGALLGVALERLVFRYFIGEPVLSVVIVTLAFIGIIDGGIRFFISSQYRAYPEALQPSWSITLPYDTSVQAPFILGVILALLTVAGLMAFFRYTVMGSILRASASDQQAAMVLGVSIERTIVVAWALSIAITSIGGILLAMSSGGAGFTIGDITILVFAAVVFGGLDSIPGAFIGGLVVGILQELGVYLEEFLMPGLDSVLPMVFLLVVIVVMPYGLFGTERIERL
ncbi:branched-chain amino acid ABC transporter permease [Halovenus salina]|uniref:Branched-chain amino acid ABC transporter permease n=1 Tax=Halovenus salina TaxID=1510225 RepID=A0ABD5W318_9EURY|nr:branched-chain amino acid ABC transporter permease [Halovenus salina]